MLFCYSNFVPTIYSGVSRPTTRHTTQHNVHAATTTALRLHTTTEVQCNVGFVLWVLYTLVVMTCRHYAPDHFKLVWLHIWERKFQGAKVPRQGLIGTMFYWNYRSYLPYLVFTLYGLASQSSTSKAQGSVDQSIKKPIRLLLTRSKQFLKALMLDASTALWSSAFHLLIT